MYQILAVEVSRARVETTTRWNETTVSASVSVLGKRATGSLLVGIFVGKNKSIHLYIRPIDSPLFILSGINQTDGMVSKSQLLPGR